MTNHLIWAAGLLGDLLLLTVLFMRKRATRFPWFTLFIVFYLLRSVGLAAALHFSGHPVHLFATMVLDLMDILLQCAVLAELTWIALRPLGGIRRFTMPLLLVASGILIVLRVAPSSHSSVRATLALMHFLLSVLMMEWAIILALLLRPLRLSWRSHVAAISFGFGIYSVALLAGESISPPGVRCATMCFFRFFGSRSIWWCWCSGLSASGSRSRGLRFIRGR